MQDPEKRKKIEEAKQLQQDEMKKRNVKLTELAKKITKWGIKEHSTVLGTSSIDYFRSKPSKFMTVSLVDNFCKIVLDNKEEIKTDMQELFP